MRLPHVACTCPDMRPDTLDLRHYVDPLTSIVLPVLFTILGGIGFLGGAVFVKHHLLRSQFW